MKVMEGGHRALEPAQRLRVELEVFRKGKRHRLVAILENRGHTPDDQHHNHDRRDLHNAQRLLAGFVHADDVFAPEVEGDDGGEGSGKIRRVDLHRGDVHMFAQFVDQPGQVQSRADTGDGTGEHVVEHQGGYRELGECSAHGLVDHLVYAAAHEHRTTLDVDGAHRVREQHDRQDEPGGRLADGRLGDPADVISARGKIAQHDGSGAPEGNKGQHHSGRDDDLN